MGSSSRRRHGGGSDVMERPAGRRNSFSRHHSDPQPVAYPAEYGGYEHRHYSPQAPYTVPPQYQHYAPPPTSLNYAAQAHVVHREASQSHRRPSSHSSSMYTPSLHSYLPVQSPPPVVPVAHPALPPLSASKAPEKSYHVEPDVQRKYYDYEKEVSLGPESAPKSELSDFSDPDWQMKKLRKPSSKPKFMVREEGKSLVVLPRSPSSSCASSRSASPIPKKATTTGSALTRVRKWPPLEYQTEITHEEAEELIAKGAPKFRGVLREVRNAPTTGVYHFFAFPGDEWDEDTDVAPFQSDCFGDISSAPVGRQTDALERPAMGHAFGIYPGTVSLAYFVAGFGTDYRATEKPLFPKGNVKKLNVFFMVDRLRKIQESELEDHPQDRHDFLYQFLLHDSRSYKEREREFLGPDIRLEREIIDLKEALGRQSWVDFSRPENQLVARFIDTPDTNVRNRFFHQLLLSLELELRWKMYNAKGTKRYMQQIVLPEKIRWDLVLAQRWLENVEINTPRKVDDGGRRGSERSSVTFLLQNKKQQVEAMQNFSRTLRWPNMTQIHEMLKEPDSPPGKLLEDRSIPCLSWFSGLLLPGPSMPYLLMAALLDCDDDAPPEFSDYVIQMAPNIGFQYRGATYWTYTCIVGKVLGAGTGTTQICGWVGPCPTTPDLARSEIIKTHQRKPKVNKLRASDVQRMEQDSDPIGPEDDTYPVEDYVDIQTQATVTRENPIDSIRIERLSFSPTDPKLVTDEEISSNIHPTNPDMPPIVTYDSSITFAITIDHHAKSIKIPLRYNTTFIAAYPCSNGPHPLLCDYYFQTAKITELVDIWNWGPRGPVDPPKSQIPSLHPSSSAPPLATSSSPSSPFTSWPHPPPSITSSVDTGRRDVEEVLVVEAFGVRENEVFARAWCAFFGLPAVVADLGRTCAACAVREAVAARVSVVVLVEREEEEEEGVRG